MIDRYETTALLDACGTLTLEHKDDLRQSVKRMKPGRKAIIIEDVKDTRSIRANRFYWGGVLRPLSEWTGYHPDELHEHFKQQFLGGEKKHIALQDGNGEVRFESDVDVVTTRKLSVREFYDFVERVRQVAAELGVVTEDPPERT